MRSHEGAVHGMQFTVCQEGGEGGPEETSVKVEIHNSKNIGAKDTCE